MLYNVTEVKKKILKIYEHGEFFRSFIADESLFPLSFKLKTPSQKSVRENMTTLFDEIKSLENLQLDLEYREFTFKSLGVQNLPVGVVIESEAIFLKFLGKTEEFRAYKREYERAVTHFPTLKMLFLERANLLLENKNILEELLQICHFFIKNPRPDIYIRELSIQGVDTKFIQHYKGVVDSFLATVLDERNYEYERVKLSHSGFEKKYGLKYELPLVRFRILDEALFLSGLSDISLTSEAFERLNFQCKNIFIVENKITMLSFMERKDSIVIFGNGYGVGMLQNANWLKDKNIYYWGDIDMDGFAILSQVRGYFPQVKSLFMDEETIEKFQDLAISIKQSKLKIVAHLNDTEHLVYKRLESDFYKENFRLEQERIPFNYVRESINAIR